MNFLHFKLDPLKLFSYQVKPALRAILHTILLHRALGNVEPILVNDTISYSRVNDLSANKHIEHHIELYYLTLLTAPTVESEQYKSVIFTISFYSSRIIKGWLQDSEEKLYWERWSIPITLLDNNIDNNPTNNNKDTNNFNNILQASLLNIVNIVTNTGTDHLPSIFSNSNTKIPNIVCYPYEIVYINPHTNSPITYNNNISNTMGKWMSNLNFGSLARVLALGPPQLIHN